MKILMHILSFEWKILWRSQTLKVLLLVILGAGLYGIYFGKFEVEKQQARIAEVQAEQRQRFDSLLVWAQLDTTLEANRAKYARALMPSGSDYRTHSNYTVVNTPSATAGLCLGQRDLYPVYYNLNITDFARKVNTGELANPMKLLTGNFDLSYVIVFLLPLLIISLFYNLYSVEKEGGTLPLLRAQTVSLFTLLLGKSIIRLFLIWGVGAILLLLGFLLQGVPLAATESGFFRWLGILLAYTTLWALVMVGVVALRRSSALSAMLGLGLWLVFPLITPALINLSVSAAQPLPNRAEVIHAVRTQNDKNWEMPKSYVLNQFYAAYPEYAEVDTTEFYPWYYATFTVLDQEAQALKAVIDEQVQECNAQMARWEWLAPAAWVHERLAGLCHTDRQSQMAFLKEAQAYHEKIKDFYFARLYEGASITLEDLRKLERGL
ncbi:MAG TPA: hypothetical protein DCP28_09760 [Cytophagales bacterium]|nr:hypothetical protein [Cytophagales bacterium]